MQIDRILFPVQALGPGNRVAIWVCGCSKGCPHCANPELWQRNIRKDVPVATISKILHDLRNEPVSIDGITFTGGDPMEQPEELARLLELIGDITDDILIYTGERYEDLPYLMPEAVFQTIQRHAGVIIDGPYIHERNDNRVYLRGSDNQNMIFLKEHLKARYLLDEQKGRQIQNVWMGDTLVSVGIHNREE